MLVPASEDVKELFFPPGKPHDAFVEIRKIIERATASVTVIDPYLNETIFQIFSNVSETVKSFKLLTSNLPPDFQLEAKKFVGQYHADLKVWKSQDFHDRFLVIDDRECWHLGASIKDAGGRAFMISRIEDEKNRAALAAQLIEAQKNASPLTM